MRGEGLGIPSLHHGALGKLDSCRERRLLHGFRLLRFHMHTSVHAGVWYNFTLFSTFLCSGDLRPHPRPGRRSCANPFRRGTFTLEILCRIRELDAAEVATPVPTPRQCGSCKNFCTTGNFDSEKTLMLAPGQQPVSLVINLAQK